MFRTILYGIDRNNPVEIKEINNSITGPNSKTSKSNKLSTKKINETQRTINILTPLDKIAIAETINTPINQRYSYLIFFKTFPNYTIEKIKYYHGTYIHKKNRVKTSKKHRGKFKDFTYIKNKI